MKKGAIEISFGVIFGVLILIFVVAGIAYGIYSFVGTKGCIDTGMLYNQLDKKVDLAWKSDMFSENAVFNVPGGAEYVCFGDVELADEMDSVGGVVKMSASRDSNVFLYPIGEGCSEKGDFKVEHVDVNGFFCLKTEKSKISVYIAKGTFDDNVKICNGECGVDDIGDTIEEDTLTSTNRTNINYCKKAQDGDLCDGLTIVYGNLYKDRCCSEHNLCCENE